MDDFAVNYYTQTDEGYCLSDDPILQSNARVRCPPPNQVARRGGGRGFVGWSKGPLRRARISAGPGGAHAG